MLRHLGRRFRAYWLWIALVGITELLGLLLSGAAFFEGDTPDPELASVGFFLIATPLPWIVLRVGFGGLWRDIRRFPLAMAVAIVAWVFGGLLFAAAFDASAIDQTMATAGLLVGGLPLLWLTARVMVLRMRRRSVVWQFKAALPHAPLDRNAFADVPFVITEDRIYYALDKGLESQAIDGLVWAYGEIFVGWFRCQLAIWNRDAQAVILPMYIRDVPEALRRLRSAAPWIASGFNRTMVDSWNFDHAEFLDLIDQHRKSRMPLELTWANGAGLVACAPRMRSESRVDGGVSLRRQDAEIAKALALWGKQVPVSRS